MKKLEQDPVHSVITEYIDVVDWNWLVDDLVGLIGEEVLESGCASDAVIYNTAKAAEMCIIKALVRARREAREGIRNYG